MDDPLLTALEAAAVLRLSPGTLKHWRSMGRGPMFATIGRRIVYRRSDLDAYIEAQFRAGRTRQES